MKKYLITQFDLHHRLYNNVLHGFTDEEKNRRLPDNPDINPVKYIAGHLLDSQYGLALLADLVVEPKWQEFFAGAGQSRARDDADYPAIESIKTEWNNLYEPTRNALDKMTPTLLNEKPPAPMDQFADSRGEFWAFLNHHVAYHIGQIGILRRGFGKAPMRYD